MSSNNDDDSNSIHNNKRPSNDGDPADAKKRPKTSTEASPADDLICPITLELPWNPVTAEDDRIYERTAIQRHFAVLEKKNQPIKSPYTNKVIGKRLSSMPQIKSLIGTLIKTGAITGDLAKKWNEKAQMQKKIDIMKANADKGGVKSMLNLGVYYTNGARETFGLPKDDKLAYKWLRKAHQCGDSLGTAMLGLLIVDAPTGTLPETIASGLVYISVAAANGSQMAAFELGKIYAEGDCAVSVNKEEAIFWLQKSLTSDARVQSEMNEMGQKTARKLLQELTEGNAPA